METYRIYAKTTEYPYIDVEAESKEEAILIAEGADGGDFVPDDNGSWEILEGDIAEEIERSSQHTATACIRLIKRLRNLSDDAIRGIFGYPEDVPSPFDKALDEPYDKLYSLVDTYYTYPIKESDKKEQTQGIEISYHNPELERIKPIEKGDWIDLRAAKRYTLAKGDFALIDLGVSIKLPEGYEAHLCPRSSTFKKWGIIQTNSMGIIDNSYCGEDDVWMMPVLATRDTVIEVNDRICQFRIEKIQPNVMLKEVESLGDKSRGGFGSTGAR